MPRLARLLAVVADAFDGEIGLKSDNAYRGERIYGETVLNIGSTVLPT
jgi:hypothetical protein